MKRLKFAVTVVLILSIALLFASCDSVASLETPEGLYLDENFSLSWREVADARGYEVEISTGGKSATLRRVTRTVISLADLEAGEYSVRVRAYGGANKDKFSAYTTPFSFTRDFESGLLYALVNGAEYTVTGIGSASGDIVIEDTYHGRPVTAIANNAFRGRAIINTVKVGANVKSIGANAFYNCVNMTSISLPAGLTEIGESAFQGCTSLQSIDVPSGVKILNKLAFGYCRGLKTVTLHEGLQQILDSAFYECNSVSALALPDSLMYVDANAFTMTTALKEVDFGKGLRYLGDACFVGSGVETLNFTSTDDELYIGAAAFQGCGFSEIALPRGTDSIGTYAFLGCENLQTVYLPDTVTSIGAFAFFGTAIYDSQAVGASFIYVDDWLVGATERLKTDVKYLKGAGDAVSGDQNRDDIPDSWSNDSDFRDRDRSEELRKNYFEIKSGIVGIADYALVPDSSVAGSEEVVSQLYDIILPNSVKYIGMGAFAQSSRLYKFECNDGSNLLSIGANAFADCASLGNLSLKEGLKEIESAAFSGCSNLNNNYSYPEKITPASLERIGSYAFYNTGIWNAAQNTGGLVVAGNWIVGFDESGSWSFDGTLDSYETEHSVRITGVADYALYHCERLQSINLSNITKIGRSAFSGCTSLINVDLNTNLHVIPDYAFFNCTSLVSISLPRDLQSIGRYAFCNSGINEADMAGRRITFVGDHAFYGCENMTSLTLSNYLTSIEPYTFYGCKLLEEVAIPNSVVEIGERAFAGCSSLSSATFGAGIKTVGDYAFRDCAALKAIEFASVETIGSHAFYACKSVAVLDLGDSVKTIGEGAFEYLAITRLVLPQSIESIGTSAFKGCALLGVAYVAGEPSYVGANAFADCAVATIYTSRSRDDVAKWSVMWNASFRPVVYSCGIEDALNYITVDVDNIQAFMGINAPVREGYEFVGWATTEGATEAQYSMEELGGVESGTRLYAVWQALQQQQ